MFVESLDPDAREFVFGSMSEDKTIDKLIKILKEHSVMGLHDINRGIASPRYK